MSASVLPFTPPFDFVHWLTACRSRVASAVHGL